MAPTQRDKNAQWGMAMGALVVGVVGMSYASVPLYRLFCQVTGYGGTVKRADEEATRAQVPQGAENRPIEIRFNADVSAALPWSFVPLQSSVVVVPGETMLAFFRARNNSDEAVVGVSSYNVTPSKIGAYFIKIQCFCFEEQRLAAGEEVDMPVFFYLDPEMLEERGLDDVKSVTLSYTFFKAKTSADDVDGVDLNTLTMQRPEYAQLHHDKD